MKRRTRLFATLAAVALLATGTATAFGYSGQVEGSITVAPTGTVACEAPFTMTATVLDAAGAPVVGQSVAWAFVPPSASDVISPTPTITDSKGKATTTVTLAPVPGPREIRATAGNVSASAVLSPATCDDGSVESAQGTPRPEGLPSTSTLPAESAGGTPIAALFLAAICALAGALALRHRVVTRS